MPSSMNSVGNRIIREARPKDMADIMKVMDAAKRIMRQSGILHDANIRIDTHDESLPFRPSQNPIFFSHFSTLLLPSRTSCP